MPHWFKFSHNLNFSTSNKVCFLAGKCPHKRNNSFFIWFPMWDLVYWFSASPSGQSGQCIPRSPKKTVPSLDQVNIMTQLLCVCLYRIGKVHPLIYSLLSIRKSLTHWTGLCLRICKGGYVVFSLAMLQKLIQLQFWSLMVCLLSESCQEFECVQKSLCISIYTVSQGPNLYILFCLF